MPRVGGKHFPYTKAGEESAKRLAKKKGMRVRNARETMAPAPKRFGKPARKIGPTKARKY